MGGGTDTTSAVLHWSMSELVRNPRVMKKAQDEVRKFGNRKVITESDLVELNYLNLVLKETLRLHPVAPLIPRVCQEGFDISDYDIPKGTTVVVNLWAIGILIYLTNTINSNMNHGNSKAIIFIKISCSSIDYTFGLTGRDSKYWKDPEEFVPERFSEGNIAGTDTKGMDLDFFPFGAGRRNCPGKFFGSAVFELTLANLLYHFNWELPCGMKHDELDMTEIFGINVKRKSPLLLYAVPRTSG